MLTPEWTAIIVAGITSAGFIIKSIVDSAHLKKLSENTSAIGATAARIEIQTDSRLTEALAKVDFLTNALADAKIINVTDRVKALETLKKENGHA